MEMRRFADAKTTVENLCNTSAFFFLLCAPLISVNVHLLEHRYIVAKLKTLQTEVYCFEANEAADTALKIG